MIKLWYNIISNRKTQQREQIMEFLAAATFLLISLIMLSIFSGRNIVYVLLWFFLTIPMAVIGVVNGVLIIATVLLSSLVSWFTSQFLTNKDYRFWNANEMTHVVWLSSLHILSDDILRGEIERRNFSRYKSQQKQQNIKDKTVSVLQQDYQLQEELRLEDEKRRQEEYEKFLEEVGPDLMNVFASFHYSED